MHINADFYTAVDYESATYLGSVYAGGDYFSEVDMDDAIPLLLEDQKNHIDKITWDLRFCDEANLDGVFSRFIEHHSQSFPLGAWPWDPVNSLNTDYIYIFYEGQWWCNWKDEITHKRITGIYYLDVICIPLFPYEKIDKKKYLVQRETKFWFRLPDMK